MWIQSTVFCTDISEFQMSVLIPKNLYFLPVHMHNHKNKMLKIILWQLFTELGLRQNIYLFFLNESML